MYQVRRVHIGKTAQLDELARECGKLYSQTVVSFWRTVRKNGHRRKSKVAGWVFHCTKKECGFTWHRDGVGAYNIRQKYRGEFGIPHVVGGMAPPIGLRYVPQVRCSSSR